MNDARKIREARAYRRRLAQLTPEERQRLLADAKALDGAKVATYVADPAVPGKSAVLHGHRIHVHPACLDECKQVAEDAGFIVRVEPLLGKN